MKARIGARSPQPEVKAKRKAVEKKFESLIRQQTRGGHSSERGKPRSAVPVG
jgi:hypothetical protein